MQNKIDLEFADGTYTFALPLSRIDELQRKTGVGIGALFARVLKGCVRVGDEVVLAPAAAEFHAIDLVETIRQGLIGGNQGIVNDAEITVSPALAGKLVENYVMDRPLSDSWALAASILGAAIVGYEPPAAKKKAPLKPQMTPETQKAA